MPFKSYDTGNLNMMDCYQNSALKFQFKQYYCIILVLGKHVKKMNRKERFSR